MNKVFKVIWSEARNAYVVVSEIAKNYGSKSCSTKKLLAMLIATGVMTCASMAPALAATSANSGQSQGVQAEAEKHTTLVDGTNTKVEKVKTTDGRLEYKVNAVDTQYTAGENVAIDKDNKISVDLSQYAKTEDVAVVYDKNKTSLRSTNATGVAENAIALGKGASAVGNSIAIGNGAYTQNGTLTNGQSVALGNGAVTGAKSTSIGSQAIGGREGTITIGANANNGALYATVIGTDSVVNSDGTAYKADLGFMKKFRVQLRLWLVPVIP